MTYCCYRISRACSLLEEASSLIYNVESGFVEPSPVGGFIRPIFPLVGNYDMAEFRGIVSKYRDNTSRASNKIIEAQEKISSCSCDQEKDNFQRELRNLQSEIVEKNNKLQELEETIKRLKEDNAKLNRDLSRFQRTVVLIGRTGSGKSTLANVLTGTNDFIESGLSVSETRQDKMKEFTAENGIKYRIIDTVGLGDTELPTTEVLRILKRTASQSNYI